MEPLLSAVLNLPLSIYRTKIMRLVPLALYLALTIFWIPWVAIVCVATGIRHGSMVVYFLEVLGMVPLAALIYTCMRIARPRKTPIVTLTEEGVKKPEQSLIYWYEIEAIFSSRQNPAGEVQSGIFAMRPECIILQLKKPKPQKYSFFTPLQPPSNWEMIFINEMQTDISAEALLSAMQHYLKFYGQNQDKTL